MNTFLFLTLFLIGAIILSILQVLGDDNSGKFKIARLAGSILVLCGFFVIIFGKILF